MAPRKNKIDQKIKKKLDLTQVLSAFDLKNGEFYENLSDDEKKQYSALVLMRFMSSAPDQGGNHEYHLLAVNDFVNRDFWTLSKHVDLQHRLLCLVGLGKKTFHAWIAQDGKVAHKNNVKDFMKQMYEGINKQELELLIKKITPDEFYELALESGADDKRVEKLVEDFIKCQSDV